MPPLCSTVRMPRVQRRMRTALPSVSDNIDDTVNYKGLKKSLLQMVESSSFFLIERMAEEAARICLQDKRVRRVDLTVDKPGALRFARSVAVQITRTQED